LQSIPPLGTQTHTQRPKSSPAKTPTTPLQTNALAGNTTPIQVGQIKISPAQNQTPHRPIVEAPLPDEDEALSPTKKDALVCFGSSICVVAPTIGSLVFSTYWALAHVPQLAIAGATINGLRAACFPNREIPESHPLNNCGYGIPLAIENIVTEGICFVPICAAQMFRHALHAYRANNAPIPQHIERG